MIKIEGIGRLVLYDIQAFVIISCVHRKVLNINPNPTKYQMVMIHKLLQKKLTLLLSKKEIELLKITPIKPTTNIINPNYRKKQKSIQRLREKAIELSCCLYTAS